MDFWASSETFQPAHAAVDRCRRAVEPYLSAAFSNSSLSALAATLRYVPIVMPTDMHARYVERSKLRRKQRLYDCAPHLNYDLYVSGEFEDQLREYLCGIALATPHLKDIGATDEQCRDFKRVLEDAIPAILLQRPDQTRH